MGAGKVAPAALIVSAEAAMETAAARDTIQNIFCFMIQILSSEEGRLAPPLLY
jgi:hypothetical protein